MSTLSHFPVLNGVAHLPHLGVIRALGEDAANFLHNQLTQDVLLMKAEQCHLGAFCNAKGRMQASFVYCKPSPEEVLLVCRRDLIAQTVKRLSMFVLRAKVKLTDATADFHLLGLVGNSLESLVTKISQEAGAHTSPQELSTTQQAWRCIPWESAQAHVLTLYPAMGQPRALMLASSAPDLSQYPTLDPGHWQLGEVMSGIAWVELAHTSPQVLSTTQQAWRCIPWESAQAHVLTLYPAMGQPRALMLASSAPDLSQYPVLDPAHWQLGEVMSGIAWVELATFEAFVPQMLNYESVDGVNFKKGCYPGQEVVARSQFRGTLKRRAYVVQSAGAITAGQEIFTSDATDQPCGLVAQVATVNDQTYAVVELQTSVVDENKLLHVGTTAGPQLHVLPLPYALKDDI